MAVDIENQEQIEKLLLGRWMLSHVCYPSAEVSDARSYPVPSRTVFWNFTPGGEGRMQGEMKSRQMCYWLQSCFPKQAQKEVLDFPVCTAFRWEYKKFENFHLLHLIGDSGGDSTLLQEYRVEILDARRLALFYSGTDGEEPCTHYFVRQ